jgi:Rod binding domain-containing protein
MMDVRVHGAAPGSPAVAGAAGSPASGADADRQQLQRAAESFEALLLAQMVKSMHSQASLTGEPSDSGGDLLRELADEQLAQALAGRGGIGLGAMLAKTLATRLDAVAPEAALAAGDANAEEKVDGP